MLFEDLHWADPTTLEGIDLVVSRLSSIPVFLVATYRPEFTPRWAGSPDCSVINLPRLTPEQSFAMIRRCAGGLSLPPTIEGIIVEKTDGVPLFIEEMTRAVIESGQLEKTGDRFVQAGGILSVSVPDSLRGSLTARLDRLVKARRVAQIGAVVGRSFSREFLSALGIHDADQLADGLDQLVASGLARIEEQAGAHNYVFKHALVQDAAYDSLLISQRRSLHTRVAELLTEQDPGLAERQPELVAHHLSAAGEDARAVPLWLKAAEIAMHSYVPILNALWVHHMSADKLAVSREWAQRALEIGLETADSDLTLVAHRALSGTYHWEGKFALARKHGDLLQAMYDPQKHWHVVQKTNTDPQTGEWIYRGQYLWMMGYPDQAVAICNARDAHARRRGHPFDLAFSLTLGAMPFEFLAMPDDLERRAEEANAVGRRFGVPLFFEMMGEISLGVAWLRAGRYAEAEAQITRGVARLASTGHRVWLAYLLALRGEALARMGRLAEAAEQIDQSIADIEQGEQRSHFAEVLRLRGLVHMLAGEPQHAERLLTRAIALAWAQEAKSWELRASMTLAELLHARGDTARALALLRRVHGWFTEGFDTPDLRQAAALLARLEGRSTRARSKGSPGRAG